MVFRKPNKLQMISAMRVAAIMAMDILAISGAFFFGLWFRADFHFSDIRADHLAGFLTAILPWCAISIVVYFVFRLYSSIWAFVGTAEIFRITGAYLVLGLIGVVVFRFDGNIMPRSSQVIGLLFSYASCMLIRFSYRLWLTAQSCSPRGWCAQCDDYRCRRCRPCPGSRVLQ